MFQIRQPFFQLNEEPPGDWGDFARTLAEPPADDEQPEGDSDAAEEETDEQEPEQPEGEEEPEEGNPEEDDPEEEPDDQPAFNDDTEIDLGEGRQAVKLSELKSGYLRQSDYTKKTQALAEEKKAFEAEKTEYEPLKGMNDFLNSNPWLNQQISQFIKEFAETGSISLEEALQDAAYGQHLNVWMARATKAEKELDSYKSKYEEMEFTGTLRDLTNDLKAEYGDLVTEEYMDTLRDRAKQEKLSVTALRDIAEGQLAKKQLEQTKQQSKESKRRSEAETIKSIQEKRNALPPQPKSKGQRPQQSVDTSGMSWGEIAKLKAGV